MKNPNHRNPKFPIITLEKAVSYLPSLSELDQSEGLSRESLARALGFEGFSGTAGRTVGALRAYYLIDGNRNRFSITEIGTRLTNDPKDREALQIAAISPRIFRKIWRSFRKAPKAEQIEFLESHNFSNEGANKAIDVYQANSEFAQLDQLEIEPALPERKPRGRKHHRDRNLLFKLPLKNGSVEIHGEIDSDEFDLVIETLKKWRDQSNS